MTEKKVKVDNKKNKARDTKFMQKMNNEIDKFDKLPKKEKLKLEKKQKIKELDSKKKWFNWVTRRKLNKNEDSSYIITMKYNNGTEKHIVIVTTKETFIHRGKMYIIIHDESTFDLSLRQYHLYYNEDSAVPINRELVYIPDSDCDDGKEEAYFSVTPSNMKYVLKMEYVRALASSVELNKYLRMVLLFSVFAFMIGMLNVLLFYFKFYR